MQVRHIIHIIRDELINEFYRYLKLEERISITPFGEIYPNMRDSTFESLVNFVRSNSKGGNHVRTYIHESDDRMKRLMSTIRTSRKDERLAL